MITALEKIQDNYPKDVLSMEIIKIIKIERNRIMTFISLAFYLGKRIYNGTALNCKSTRGEKQPLNLISTEEPTPCVL